jgi:hypothetical protein
MTANLDTEVRLQLYREFVRTGRAPSTVQLAETMRLAVEDLRAALERLASAKAIVLQPESRDVLIAAPLCAVPTPFLVHTGARSYFGTCIWDGLGILAMLKTDGTLETSCPCCGEALAIEIRGGKPLSDRGIVHFAVPARRWWENIVFT